MTLTLSLPEEQETARGVSAEEYVQEVLTRDLNSADRPGRRISELFREIWGDVPDEVHASCLRMAQTRLDHYVYGVPKRSR